MKILIELTAHEAQIGVETGLLQALADAMKEETAKVLKKTAPELPKEKAPEPEPEAAPEPEPEKTTEAPAPKATLEEARAEMAKLMKAGKQEQVVELFARFGAKKLTGVPEDKYGELIAAARAL